MHYRALMVCCQRFILACVLLGSGSAYAVDVLQLESTLMQGVLGPYIEVYVDESSSLSIQDVDNPPIFRAFQPVTEELSFGYSEAAYWLRFTVFNPTETARVLLVENGYSLLDSIELYMPTPQGFQVVRQGDQFPYAQRPFKLRNFLYELELAPKQIATYYMRVSSTSSVTIPLNYYTPHAYYEHLHDNQAWLGLFYGICFGLWAYNLFLFLSTRERSYLYYLGVVSANVYIAACFDGFSYRVFPNAVFWQSIAIYFGIGCNIISSSMFCREYLTTRNTVPRLDRMLKMVIIFGSIETLCLFLFHSKWLSLAILLTIALNIVFILLTGWMRIRQHYEPAKLFMLSWFVLLAPIFVGVLNASGILQLNALTPYLQKIGVASEMIILSLALGNRINLLKRAEQAAIEKMHQERLTIIKQANEALEHKVSERTIELKRALEEISSMNQKLKDLSIMDQLTSLYNRRHFDLALQSDWQRCCRAEAWLSLIVIDIDHFKQFNDQHGHLCGDACLVHVAAILRKTVMRDTDTLARFGGEEFVLLMPHTYPEGAEFVAEKIRSSIAYTPLSFMDKQYSVTVSLGCASHIPRKHEKSQQLFERADKLLYQAKKNGRNQFVAKTF